jgi:hypothetical protein
MGRGSRAGITTCAVAAVLASMAGMAGSQAAAQVPSRATSASSSAVVYSGLSSSPLKITSSHGKRLYLSVSSTKRAGIGHPSLTIVVSTSRAFGVGETHDWSFTINQTDLTYNSHTGRGKLFTGKLLKGFGTLTLAFTKTSQSTSTCKPSSGDDIRVAGKLSGKLFFNTQTGPHGWGTLGSRTHKITFHSPNHVNLLTGGCPIGVGGGSSGCVRGLFWSAPSVNSASSSTEFFGQETKVGSRTTTIVDVNHTTNLKSPADASRTDSLFVREPAPTLKSGVLTITTSGHLLTGSATIDGSNPQANNFSCTSGHKSETERTTDYTGNWSSTLAAHFGATGKVAPPKTGTDDSSYTTQTF